MGLTEEIDIPESGAVFTLGKSYLSENHQSYFFIKNDAIRKLICGHFQSAVVCESGRLFVWGENQFGQLGIGSAEIVTKPSCVKVIKALGYKVRNVAYGQAFGVILTENSKVFYSGRSVFNEKVRFREKFWNLGNDVLVCRKPFEIEEFGLCLQDDQGNVTESLVDISAGHNHFVALTGSGKLYGWGSNGHHQIGAAGDIHKPVLISRNEVVRVVSCGRKCTAFISAKNEIFIVGTLKHLQFGALSKINTTSFEELMYSIYISVDDEIYLVINSGEIFKSTTKDENLTFTPHNVISENIRKICTGNGFVSIVTESNKLLTTFSEKSSANNNGRLKSPRELRKFSRLNVLDAVSGNHHLLVHGVHPNRRDTITSTSSNEFEDDAVNHNIVIPPDDFSRTYTKDATTSHSMLADKLNECFSAKEMLASKIPIADVRRKSFNDKDSKLSSRKNSQNSFTEPIEAVPASKTPPEPSLSEMVTSTGETERPLSQHSIEKSLSLNEFEKLEQEQIAAETAELAKETNVLQSPATKIVDHIIEHQLLTVASPESEVSRKSSAITEIYLSPRAATEPDESTQPSDGNESTPAHGNEIIEETKNHIALPEFCEAIDNAEHEEPVASRRQTIINDDDEEIQMQLSQKFGIKFIDNGIEMSTPLDPNEMEPPDIAGVAESDEDQAILLTAEQIVDKVLGEELNGDQELVVVADMKEETIQALKEVVEDVIVPVDVHNKKMPAPISKLPSVDQLVRDVIAHVDDDENDDGERTTASITSIPSDDKNTFVDTDDDNDSRTTRDGGGGGGSPRAAPKNGRVKRFISDMRTKAKGISCKSSAAELVDDNEIKAAAHDQNSRICSVM